MNINFTLEFGHKNTLIRFSDSKNTHVVGENAPWETVPYMNAITHIMNQFKPAYDVMEAGMYLHKSLVEIVDALPNKNVGYITHPVLIQMAEQGLLRRDLDTKPGVYRLKWNGLFLTAEDLPFIPYAEGENKQISHDRDAFRLIMAFEVIRKAAANGTNIRLLTTEKMQPRVDLFAKQYGLFLAGEFEALYESMKKGIDGQKTYETLKHFANRSAAAVQKGTAFAAPASVETIGGVFEANALVGKKIQFVQGNGEGTTLPTEWTVTDGLSNVPDCILSVGDVAATMKERNLRITVVGAPEETKKVKRATRKARVNEPVEITE